MLPIPKVAIGDWVRVGWAVDGYVLSVYPDGSIDVGYYQHQVKATRKTVVWTGDEWDFNDSGPDGSYLRGKEEAIVKRGPSKLQSPVTPIHQPPWGEQ